jgi:hypothetical protein
MWSKTLELQRTKARVWVQLQYFKRQEPKPE